MKNYTICNAAFLISAFILTGCATYIFELSPTHFLLQPLAWSLILLPATCVCTLIIFNPKLDLRTVFLFSAYYSILILIALSQHSGPFTFAEKSQFTMMLFGFTIVILTPGHGLLSHLPKENYRMIDAKGRKDIKIGIAIMAHNLTGSPITTGWK